MKMGKVFYAQPGDALTAGWYYSIDLGEPQGPFSSQLMAGILAREEIEPTTVVGSFFELHRCWRCNNGEKACVQGNSHNCEFPRALND